MKRRNQQSGMSIFGILIIMGLFSFCMTIVVRVLPVYMEGRTVKTAIEGVAAASNAEQSLGEVGKRLAGSFNTNQIEGLKPAKVKIYRDKGKIIINANYESRTSVFEGFDAVVMFNDNIVTID